MKYDFGAIERKWQKFWREKKTYEPDLNRAKRPFYNLMMFPYPSAEGLHVGNMYAFTGADIYGRFKRMQGHDVFEPIGLDGFGIHSENYALKIGKHPAEQAKVSEKHFYDQLLSIGNGFAWNERLETYDPEYYRWTQWIFREMFRRGLAYRRRQSVNWCPSCKTVLADEQAASGACERCGTKVIKKDLEQWFFRITKYAEPLLKNLEKLDWSERVKIAQRNWIGKSEGAMLEFPIEETDFKVEVFTTRPETVFGATYLVLAPENPLITALAEEVKNFRDVVRYVERAKKKHDEERLAEGKEKTGIELKGVRAVNPANKETIPVWVADYVLGHVGTGAIMAVPAHDERDFEFAKKFNLRIRQVIAPKVMDKEHPWQPDKPITKREIIHVLLKHPSQDKVVALRSKKFPWLIPITGGIEGGEDPLSAAAREIKEETGYENFHFVKRLPFKVFAEFYAPHKNVNRLTLCDFLFFELVDETREEISEEERALHNVEWLPIKDLHKLTPVSELDFMIEFLRRGDYAYTGEGILLDSGKFDGMDSRKAKWEIVKHLKGKRITQYRLRDWLVSRQRYWGPPIPMVYCESCAMRGKGERKEMPGWYAVPERDLPVELPKVENFRPTGTGISPLASVKSFYETKCPACKGKARRETDVSDTFLDSAWYYLRYPSTHSARSGQVPWDSEITKKWFPVSMYTGGAEHSVLHLLYVRFLALALHDIGLLEFGKSAAPAGEPFPKFRAHGLLICEGAKMSKSKGNVVNPDELVKRFGADTLRMYLMFLAPFEQGGDFRDAGIVGIARFLERVWRLVKRCADPKVPMGPEFAAASSYRAPDGFKRCIHRTIKKVTEDIESLRYNTAISALMILLNDAEKQLTSIHLPQYFYETFAKLLAPFAPHIAEELWHSALGYTSSIHRESWPSYDPKLVVEKTFTLVIQVDGKVRDSVEAPLDITGAQAQELALGREQIRRFLPSGKPRRAIYVPGRLINLVT